MATKVSNGSISIMLCNNDTRVDINITSGDNTIALLESDVRFLLSTVWAWLDDAYNSTKEEVPPILS
jgi:hypothetical protein